MDPERERHQALCQAIATSYGLDPGDPAGEGPSARARRRLADPGLGREAEALCTDAERRGLGLLWREHPAWPRGLDAPPDPPWVLWCQGDEAVLDRDGLTVVGTRHPSAYGLHACDRFVEAACAAGLAVWSGLARGIDGRAHEAALDCGGTAVAVLGSGLDHVYPEEHVGLARRVVAGGGLLLSELPPAFRPVQYAFPRRNRLLAACTLGTLVVEAGLRSGTTITAELATGLGRSVWAVPGPWSSPTSAGCHALIRDGALLAEGPDGLLAELGLAGARTPAATLGRGSDEARILAALDERPQRADALATRVGLGLDATLVLLDGLEGRGRIERRAGGLWTPRAGAGRERRE
ncbi:MAG: DNA-processing protein DprA [Planctomycetota bacterium]